MIGRERVVAEETPSQMCSARWLTQYGAPRGLQNLARAAQQLTGDKEGNEDVREPGELPVACDEIVLVAAVGVAGRVRVVLEEVDVARDSFLVQASFGVHQESFENALACFVVRDQFGHIVTFGCRVFRM